MRARVHVLVRVHERVRVAENPKTPLASEGCSQCQKIPFAPPRSAENPQTPLAKDALSSPRGVDSCGLGGIVGSVIVTFRLRRRWG